MKDGDPTILALSGFEGTGESQIEDSTFGRIEAFHW